MRYKTLIYFLLLCFFTGCAQPRLQADLPKVQNISDKKEVEQVEITSHYRIITTNSETTAKDIGALLESLYITCSELLGPPVKRLSHFHVYAFPSKNEYESRVAELMLQQRDATGFYTPADPAGIYLPLVEINGEHPFFTLAHEGLHQYLHETKGIKIPASSAKLPAVPLWLNEGLALNMEAALVNGTTLEPGRLHRPRLKHLQGLIESGKAPSVKEVLSKTYGTPFSNADYSVAWGVTYILLNEASFSGEWQSFWLSLQESLQSEGRQMVNNEQNSTVEALVNLQTKWAEHLQARSSKIFQDHVIGQDQSRASWQKHWETAILRLTYK